MSQYYLEADACLSSIMLVSLRWSSSSEGVLFVGGWLLLSSCSRARLRLVSPAPCFSISLMSRSFYEQKKPLLLKPIHMNCASLTSDNVSIVKYRKIPKISSSKFKPPQTGNAKTLRLIAPSNISPPRACSWKIVLKYKLKPSKNGKFTSNYKASPIDFETQISLRR